MSDTVDLAKALTEQLDCANERIADLEAEVAVWKRHWKDKDREFLDLRAKFPRCSQCNGTGKVTLRLSIHGERDEVWQERCPICQGKETLDFTR